MTDSDSPTLHDRALDDLTFIRRTMEGAASFTDVPGWGLVAVGVVALATAPIAARQPSAERWLAVWLCAATVAAIVGSAAMVAKMRRRIASNGARLLNVPTRKFLLGFWPAIFAGALITIGLLDPFTPGIEARLTAHIFPGLWLVLYGLGVTTAGAFSIRAVPMMGLALMILGGVALLLPAVDGDLMMAVGFGTLQIGFGTYIARRHGG